MTTSPVETRDFVLYFFVAFKNSDGSHGPYSSTNDSGTHSPEKLADILKGLVEDGYVLDRNISSSQSDTELFLVLDVPAVEKRVGWRVQCQIALAVGVQEILAQVLSEFDEATRSKFYGQPS